MEWIPSVNGSLLCCISFAFEQVETSTGSAIPASFDRTSRCPDEIVRRIRVTASYEDHSWNGKLLESYDTQTDRFIIAPCCWWVSPSWFTPSASSRQRHVKAVNTILSYAYCLVIWYCVSYCLPFQSFVVVFQFYDHCWCSLSKLCSCIAFYHYADIGPCVKYTMPVHWCIDRIQKFSCFVLLRLPPRAQIL